MTTRFEKQSMPPPPLVVVAGAAEVSVDASGKLKVHRIVAATDPTYAVNPAQIDRQVAGSFVYGLSALYYQECTLKDGCIVELRCRRSRRSTCRTA